MYIIMRYTLYYYEDKYFISLFLHFKYRVKIYNRNFIYFIKNKHK